MRKNWPSLGALITVTSPQLTGCSLTLDPEARYVRYYVLQPEASVNELMDSSQTQFAIAKRRALSGHLGDLDGVIILRWILRNRLQGCGLDTANNCKDGNEPSCSIRDRLFSNIRLFSDHVAENSTKGSTRLGAFLPEDGSTAGFRKVVFH
jgi:hypothetical protein